MREAIQLTEDGPYQVEIIVTRGELCVGCRLRQRRHRHVESLHYIWCNYTALYVIDAAVQVTEVTVSATVGPPSPIASVFQSSLGEGNDITFSTDYDVVYGAPGFGVSVPPNDALSSLQAQAEQALTARGYTQQQIAHILAGAAYDWIGGHWNLVLDPRMLATWV